MRTLLAVGLLVVCSDGAFAEPKWTINPYPSGQEMQAVQPTCTADELCQHGTLDTLVGLGLTLDATQQLGITCSSPFPGGGIVKVGFFSEFWNTPGDMDIVIYNADNGTELSRTTVFVPGHPFPETAEYEFPIPKTVVQNACVMLCPIGSTSGATGEDESAAPSDDSYFSQSGCSSCPLLLNPPTAELTIWACWEDDIVSTEDESWGAIKSRYDETE